MNNDIDYTNRQLIPRLLPYRTANLLSLNISSNSLWAITNKERNNYIKLKNEWKLNKSIVVALQILTYELYNKELNQSKEIIIFLNKNKKFLNKIEIGILNAVLDKSKNVNFDNHYDIDEERVHNNIRLLKNDRELYINNPIVWCDLGYYYTVLGQYKKAKKCYKAAIALNSNNKFIIRSASRFFLHTENPEEGLYLIRKSPNIKNDPGLISAEIAFSEILEIKSKFIDHGILLIKNRNIGELEKNELFAQLATIEFSYGKKGRGKKYVESSLYAPNENILAQFEYLSKSYKIDDNFSSDQYDVLCKHEAETRKYFYNENYKKSLESALKWIDFQPFSSHPAIMGSYISAVALENHKKAIDIAKRALKNSPRENMLLNNLAYSYASVGRVEDALKTLKRINLFSLEPYEKYAVIATIGLTEINRNNLEVGKKYYAKSISYFRTTNNFILLSRALLFYGKALIEKKDNSGYTYIKESYNLANRMQQLEIKYLAEKVLKKVHIDDTSDKEEVV